MEEDCVHLVHRAVCHNKNTRHNKKHLIKIHVIDDIMVKLYLDIYAQSLGYRVQDGDFRSLVPISVVSTDHINFEGKSEVTPTARNYKITFI